MSVLILCVSKSVSSYQFPLYMIFLGDIFEFFKKPLSMLEFAGFSKSFDKFEELFFSIYVFRDI